MKTLYGQMKETALKQDRNISVVFYGKKYSFAKMLRFVDSAAAGLKLLGVKKGVTVTLCMPNSPSAQIAFYAVNRLGAKINLVHPLISPVQLNYSMKKTNSSLLIAYDLFLYDSFSRLEKNITVLLSKSDFFAALPAKLYFKLISRKKRKIKCSVFEDLLKNKPLAEPHCDFGDDEPAVFLPSGGTVSDPKIIVHPNRVFNDLCAKAPHLLSKDIKNYKTMYSVLPIFHGFGLCTCIHMCAQIGFKNVLCLKFSPKLLTRAVKKHKVDMILGVPAMFTKLLGCKKFVNADLSSIKDCFVGGDTVPQSLLDSFNRVLKERGSLGALYAGYGLTETVTVCAVNNARAFKKGSAGKPLPDVEIRIIKDGKALNVGEVGEIAVKTSVMMLGYLGEKENPVREIDGESWLFTGDLGYMDSDGFLFFKQRIKNMIKISGVPVFPSEIEDVALKVAGVKKAAAVERKDGRARPYIKLFIEPEWSLHSPEAESAGGVAVDGSDGEIGLDGVFANFVEFKKRIMEECRLSLITYAIPREIELREALPLTQNGKIDRRALENED